MVTPPDGTFGSFGPCWALFKSKIQLSNVFVLVLSVFCFGTCLGSNSKVSLNF